MKRFTLAILLGWLLLGHPAPASAAAGDVPPRALTDQGLTNLTALTRLIGYVRFFHPSDQAAGLANADWDALAMAGVERVEAARDPRELAAALSELFSGIAPTVRVLPFPAPSKSAAELSEVTGGGAIRLLAWRHEGVDLHTPLAQQRGNMLIGDLELYATVPRTARRPAQTAPRAGLYDVSPLQRRRWRFFPRHVGQCSALRRFAPNQSSAWRIIR